MISQANIFLPAYSTQDGRDFSDPNLLLPSQPVTNKDDRWFLSYAFEQTLWRNPQDSKKAWGLFGQVGFSDGNPNAVQKSFLGGIGGTSPINGRGRDKFGVGLFYVGFSDDLKDAIQPIIRLRDEYGAEFFFQFFGHTLATCDAGSSDHPARANCAGARCSGWAAHPSHILICG